MAQHRMTIKFRWWVRPYLWALSLFATFFAFGMDEDDLAAWLEYELDWVTTRGLKLELH